MAVDLAALKSEILNDPQTYGYATWVSAGEPENVAAALNKTRDGTDGETAIQVRRADISPGEILEAIDTRDFETTVTQIQGSWFESLTQLARVRFELDDGTETTVLGNLKRILQNPGPQGSRARVIALSKRFGSRAEQLFGRDTVISPQDVGNALRS